MSSGSGLTPFEHASFAVVSRLLSCLVTEELLPAFYTPLCKPNPAVEGLLVILSTHILSEQTSISRALRSRDIFVVVPLRNAPVFKDTAVYPHGRSVGLVDPLDMLPVVYEATNRSAGDLEPVSELGRDILESLTPPLWDLGCSPTLSRCTDAVSLWNKFVEGIFISDSTRKGIERELASSFEWQYLSYKSPPPAPTLRSTPLEWEQSLVAGHPTHPMHRARLLPSNANPQYNWYRPRIRFAAIPRRCLNVFGQFEQHIRPIAERAAKASGRILPCGVCSVIVPVHELQISNMVSRLKKDVEILHADISVDALAQSSIRTVVIPELPTMAVKLAVGVKISSSLRTISHFTATFGPQFSAQIVPKLAINPDIMTVELEPHSVVLDGVEPEVAKHFSVVLREEYQAPEGQGLVVCAALLEMDHLGAPPGVPAVQFVFGLDTQEKRLAFLDRYIQLACEALLPPLLTNGVAFEAHAQNVLVRYNATTGEVLGFVVRDLGGIRVHPATLRESTGVDFEFLPNHCVVTSTLEETYPKFYHTFVHNHLQRLIRVLGLHSNGLGWEILRKHLRNNIPADHPVYAGWLGGAKFVKSKSLLRMRMQDLYRDMVYSTVPNMILYQPDERKYD
ncbi:hypothetical protein BDN72DRAFT_558264 [Pluteus cervinus]|uniref:Uncharacterized protein n=1 Tax=Pluteus cervinus TaxID=181527 RepID=A0ACD3BBT5_9AGAR|nr:hypothetical protein BDN72DRAFT_558264 [Pluteus cervinus]